LSAWRALGVVRFQGNPEGNRQREKMSQNEQVSGRRGGVVRSLVRSPVHPDTRRRDSTRLKNFSAPARDQANLRIRLQTPDPPDQRPFDGGFSLVRSRLRAFLIGPPPQTPILRALPTVIFRFGDRTGAGRPDQRPFGGGFLPRRPDQRPFGGGFSPSPTGQIDPTATLLPHFLPHSYHKPSHRDGQLVALTAHRSGHRAPVRVTATWWAGHPAACPPVGIAIISDLTKSGLFRLRSHQAGAIWRTG
jgi:hypothetical protein